jgi:CelD/BcsL family acetyltransferase involved in cellulose biosynthesis
VSLKLRSLDSIAELRQVAPAWDDLWQRSDVLLPTMRAELLAQWLEQFAPRTRFQALCVERDGQMLAALPLVETCKKRIFKVADLPNSPWSPSGNLLLDCENDADAVLDLLVAGFDQLPWPLVWLDTLPPDDPQWQAFLAATERRGLQTAVHTRYQVGQIEINHDWPDYQARWSKNHRRSMRKAVDRAADAGGVTLTVHSQPAVSEVDDLLRRGFEVEDRGWKGAAGSSVLRCPGIFDFFCRQARQLAEWGQLELVFLEHAGQPIAFEYSYRTKHTCLVNKIGYDERFADLVPGQLLRVMLLERYFADPEMHCVDFIGPLVDATAKWSTRSYPLARLVVAPRHMFGQLLMHGYQFFQPRLRRLRAKSGDAPAQPQLGAARNRQSPAPVLAE